jgi:hypothetical protein
VAEVFRTPFTGEQPDALVVHCSDPRFQVHFQDFLRRHKGLDRYALFAIPGGAQSLTLAGYLPKFSWAGWRWMKFLMGVTKPRRAILIAHEDCRWYLDGHLARPHRNVRDRQIQDLHAVKAEINERFSGIDVELYFARLEGDHVLFDAV